MRKDWLADLGLDGCLLAISLVFPISTHEFEYGKNQSWLKKFCERVNVTSPCVARVIPYDAVASELVTK